MKYIWLDEYCLSNTGTEKEYKIEWEATLYRIGGKMFAMVGEDKQGRQIVTLKCEPDFGQFLRDTHKDIMPGYYMNKTHWNSVDLNGDVPDDIVRQMIDMSYTLVLHSLSLKMQRAILEVHTE